MNDAGMLDAGMLRGKLEGRPDASVGLKGTEQELSGPNKNGHAAALWEGKVSRNGSLSFYFFISMKQSRTLRACSRLSVLNKI